MSSISLVCLLALLCLESVYSSWLHQPTTAVLCSEYWNQFRHMGDQVPRIYKMPPNYNKTRSITQKRIRLETPRGGYNPHRNFETSELGEARLPATIGAKRRVRVDWYLADRGVNSWANYYAGDGDGDSQLSAMSAPGHMHIERPLFDAVKNDTHFARDLHDLRHIRAKRTFTVGKSQTSSPMHRHENEAAWIAVQEGEQELLLISGDNTLTKEFQRAPLCPNLYLWDQKTCRVVAGEVILLPASWWVGTCNLANLTMTVGGVGSVEAWHPVLLAAAENDMPTLVELLKKERRKEGRVANPAWIHNGLGPIHHAAAHGHLKVSQPTHERMRIHVHVLLSRDTCMQVCASSLPKHCVTGGRTSPPAGPRGAERRCPPGAC